MKSGPLALVLLSIIPLTGACHHATRVAAAATQPVQVTHRLEARPARADTGEIPRQDLPELAGRVAALRVEPASITLRVGDTVVVQDVVHVLAIDSAGISLGRLPVYDSQLWPGAAALAGIGRVTGLRAGVSELHIGFPRVLWHDRADSPPVAQVRLEVRD